MHLSALPPHVIEIGIQPAAHDFINLAETERSPQPARNPPHARRAALRDFRSDLIERGLQSVRRKADGVGKVRVQDQEFRDAQWLQIRRVGLAIGLESGAGSQQADPFQVLRGGGVAGMLELAEMHAHQRGNQHGPFEKPSDLNELPAFAVGHGGIRDALEQMCPFLNRGQKIACVPGLGRRGLLDFVK